MGPAAWSRRPPAAQASDTAPAMQTWIQAALNGQQTLTPISIVNNQGQAVSIVQGYETTRPCRTQVDGQTLEWTERVFVVYSDTYAQAQARGLDQRLATATAKLNALTPPRARGKRQITDEALLMQAADAILKA
jgi:hypothetical protein